MGAGADDRLNRRDTSKLLRGADDRALDRFDAAVSDLVHSEHMSANEARRILAGMTRRPYGTPRPKA